METSGVGKSGTPGASGARRIAGDPVGWWLETGGWGKRIGSGLSAFDFSQRAILLAAAGSLKPEAGL